MAGDASINLRVSRLENEVESIYELITDIRSVQDEHTQRFETLETTMNQRFETLETTMNQRFETLEATMNQRFGTIETTLAEVVRRLPEPS